MELTCRMLETGALDRIQAELCIEARAEIGCDNCAYCSGNDKEIFENKRAELQSLCPEFSKGRFDVFGSECQGDCEVCNSEYAWDLTQLIFRQQGE
jgi:hypothetical protein